VSAPAGRPTPIVRRTTGRLGAASMLDATATVVLVLIFLLAAFLALLPRVLGRRARRGRGDEDATPRSGGEPEVGVAKPRLRDRLGRSNAPFRGLRSRWGSRRLDDEVWDELEETLLLADVGVPTTTRLVERIREDASASGVREADELPALLQAEISAQLGGGAHRTLHLTPNRVNVWLLVGVNGVGKTTTAAKLAHQVAGTGRRVLLVAADTFRAAAADQLAQWAERLAIDLVRGQEGADPGSVVFDAMQAAEARRVDVVIVDTAGRLHTKVNLMEELKKVRRIVERTTDALGEVLLVLDASTGQNGLAQAREFTDAVGVTGVVLAKLDGTAKGGIVLAVESELGVPVKLIGVGETAADLVAFDPDEFADALVGQGE
jgi:fused signal recognition particle receptor